MLWSSLFVCLFGRLSCSVFSELPGSVVWCLTLIWQKLSVIICQIFLLFFSLFSIWYSYYTCYTFYSCLRYLVLFSSSLCPLCFSVLEDAIYKSFNSELLSSVLSSLLLIPSKAFFISVTVFLISSISFLFLLGFLSLYFHCPSILSCCALSSRVLSILVTVLLNSWCDNSSTPAVSVQKLTPFSDCVSCLSVRLAWYRASLVAQR